MLRISPCFQGLQAFAGPIVGVLDQVELENEPALSFFAETLSTINSD